MKSSTPPYVGKYILVKGKLLEGADYDFGSTPAILSVYEVIRLIDGVPLFIEDHLARLMNSILLISRKPDVSFSGIADEIHWLSKQNMISNGNVKVICNFLPKKNRPDSVIIYFIPHKYPEENQYVEGIKMQGLVMERPNPNAKVVNTALTHEVINLKSQYKVDEILLVTHNNIITEGSKSNIFFVKDDVVLTAGHDLVLAGITRDKVIEICKLHGIVCKETKIQLEELSKMSGAFITGTSPKIMPVNRINQFKYQTQLPLIKTLQKLYDDMISSYVLEHKVADTANQGLK